MQNDRLRDFLKFFRFHLAWFILSAGFFAVILISGIFFSTKYVVDTATEQTATLEPSATPEELAIVATPEPPTPPTPPTPPAAEPLVIPTPATPKPISTVTPISSPTPIATPTPIVRSPANVDLSLAEYVVKPGDTLWKIAKQKYGDGYAYSQISQENNLKNANLIQVGQTLSLPRLNEQEKGTITDSAWSDDKTIYVDYTIVSGDSLWKIAERELGDPYRWREIYQANKSIIGDNPDLIYPDVVLKIPSDSQTVSANPASFNWTSSLLQ
ncbi:MAG: hypothetical protein QG639_342 [Patescibacteria group bacterium]|nr:hypothetical protein [Patescibacteria group bacterium]